MGFNLAIVYLVGGKLRMEMREPTGVLYNCNFVDDAKSSNILDSLSKPQVPQKNISLLSFVLRRKYLIKRYFLFLEKREIKCN